MNFTAENCIEMPQAPAPISAILGETDSILSECLASLDKLNTCVSGMGRLEEKKADAKCMRDAVCLTADKARMVQSGIIHLMEAIGV